MFQMFLQWILCSWSTNNVATGQPHRKLLALNATFVEKHIEERCATFLSSINKWVTILEENSQAQITQITPNLLKPAQSETTWTFTAVYQA